MRDTWLRLILNEDRAMTARASLFLIVNSIMVGGYAIATSCELRLLLAIAGLIFTLVWFYLSERGRKEITIFWEKGKKCEAELAEEEQVLTPVDEARKKFCWFWKLQARIILSWILPLGWAVVWSVILIMSATGVF